MKIDKSAQCSTDADGDFITILFLAPSGFATTYSLHRFLYLLLQDNRITDKTIFDKEMFENNENIR